MQDYSGEYSSAREVLPQQVDGRQKPKIAPQQKIGVYGHFKVPNEQS